MDLLVEILMDIYLSLVEVLVPEKRFKKWQEVLLKVAGVLVSLTIVALILVGISFIYETEQRMLGIILLSIGGVLLTIQIALCVFVLVKQAKAEKAKNAPKFDEQQNNHE